MYAHVRVRITLYVNGACLFMVFYPHENFTSSYVYLQLNTKVFTVFRNLTIRP